MPAGFMEYLKRKKLFQEAGEIAKIPLGTHALFYRVVRHPAIAGGLDPLQLDQG